MYAKNFLQSFNNFIFHIYIIVFNKISCPYSFGRIFEDEAGKMNRSLLDIGGEALVVSQFTLYADCRKGRRPGFDAAGDPAAANDLYEYFAERLKAEGVGHVATGRFGADMLVSLENDGPATFLLSHPWEFSTTTNPEAEE